MLQKSCFKYGERFLTSFFGFFGNFFCVRPDFTKVEHFLSENMENISIMSKTFPEQQASCKCFLIHRIKSNFSIFERQKYSLVTNISDNGNNNEKSKYLKIWVGIFQVGIFWVGIFRGGGGDFLGGSLMGGNFPGVDFPDTLNYNAYRCSFFQIFIF